MTAHCAFWAQSRVLDIATLDNRARCGHTAGMTVSPAHDLTRATVRGQSGMAHGHAPQCGTVNPSRFPTVAASRSDVPNVEGVRVPAHGAKGVKTDKLTATVSRSVTAISFNLKGATTMQNTATAQTATVSAAATVSARLSAADKVANNAAAAAKTAAANVPAYVNDFITTGLGAYFTHPTVEVKGRAFTADGDLILHFADVSGAKNQNAYVLFTVSSDGNIDAANTDRKAFKAAKDCAGHIDIALLDTVQDLLNNDRMPNAGKLAQLAGRARLLGAYVPVTDDGKLDRATLKLWDDSQVRVLCDDMRARLEARNGGNRSEVNVSAALLKPRGRAAAPKA